MPWKYTEEYYREYTRTTWNDAADAYVDLMRRMAPFRADLVARLAPKEGEVILDLGTGPGEPALTIAERVGPRGRVVGVDLSERMVAIARRSAEAKRILNIEFCQMDSARLDLASATFDAAVSCFGFQIFTDPERAAHETRRVLAPAGRVAVSVWGRGDRVPLLDTLVGPMLAHAEPDESGYLPTPYEAGGPGEMVTFLEEAGYRHATETRVQHTLDFSSADAYFHSVLGATPLGHSLAEEPAEVQAAILREAREGLERWRSDAGYSLPAECVLVSAQA